MQKNFVKWVIPGRFSVQVPESGLYTFYMTCHYQCELWISSDSTAEHKRRILQVTDTNNDLLQNAWDKYVA